MHCHWGLRMVTPFRFYQSNAGGLLIAALVVVVVALGLWNRW